jgi:hypothetical protein
MILISFLLFAALVSAWLISPGEARPAERDLTAQTVLSAAD